MPDETSPTPAKRSFLSLACLGCGGLAVLLGAGFAVASVSASRSFERRMVVLAAELEELRAARPPERTPLFHLAAEGRDGDAVDDYAAIQWVLGPAPGMTAAPPGAEATGLGRDHPKASGVPFTLAPPAGTTVEAMLDARQPLTPEMQKTLALYGPLAQHVRSGVRRTRCDWKVDPTQGVAVELPNLLALRSVAQYMACEAADQAALPAARTGLELVAFGRDVARHDTLIGVMLGLAIQGIGVRTIARALDQGPTTRPMTAVELDELLAALDRLPPLDLDRVMACERLSMQVQLAQLSGHSHAPRARPGTSGPAAPAGLGVLSRVGPLFFEREMAGYTDAMAEVAAVLKRPAAERAAASQAVMARFERHIFASIAVPNLAKMQDHAERANVEVDLCRLLLAAQLHRLATGEAPTRDDDLAPRLGGELPRDPFSGAPVRWAVKDGRLRVWSVGPNLTDEDGTPGKGADDGDVVLSTKLP